MPKKVKGPFYFFMTEVQKELFKTTGRRLALEDVKAIASPRWNNLNKESRKKYEDMAKSGKTKIIPYEYKRASDGTRLSVIDRMNREREEEERDIVISAQKLVRDAYKAKTLLATPFYLLNFVGLCKDAKLPEIPREVGLVEYTLESGVIRHYHRFIRPPKIPTGYASKAKDATEQYHGIPVLHFDQDTDNYHEVYLALVRMVTPSRLKNGRILVYCKREDMAQNKECLAWLHDNSGSMDPLTIRFADLTVLIAEFRSVVQKPFHSRTIIDDGLARPTYDYYQGVRCAYHEEIDNCNCALGFCKRYCFLMNELVIEHFGVAVTKRHLPLLEVEDPTQRNGPSRKGQTASSVWPKPRRDPENPSPFPIRLPNLNHPLPQHIRRRYQECGLDEQLKGLQIRPEARRVTEEEEVGLSSAPADVPKLRQPTVSLPKAFEHSLCTVKKNVGIGRGKRDFLNRLI